MKPYYLSIILYILLSIIVLPYFIYQINPDGISYISISQKYIAGDWTNAVNGYWSPLFSWLLIPFLMVGIKPLVACKLLSLVVGLLIILKIRKLRLLPVIAVLMIYYAVSVISPDLLFVLICIIYLSRNDLSCNGYVTAMIGALMYLTKAYGMPLFALHYSLTHFKDKNYFKVMAIYLVLCSLWIIPLSLKYGKFTAGTAGIYNVQKIAPHCDKKFHEKGLYSPPNDTAVSVWEDISFTAITPKWSDVKYSESFIYEMGNIFKNAKRAVMILFRFSFLFPLMFLFIARRYKQYRNWLLFAGIIISGYVMVSINARYIWIISIFMVMIASDMIKSRSIFSVLLILSFLIYPIGWTIKGINTGRAIYLKSLELSHISGDIASDTHWGETLYMAYYNNWRYYGVTSDTLELKKYEIDHYLKYGRSK